MKKKAFEELADVFRGNKSLRRLDFVYFQYCSSVMPKSFMQVRMQSQFEILGKVYVLEGWESFGFGLIVYYFDDFFIQMIYQQLNERIMIVASKENGRSQTKSKLLKQKTKKIQKIVRTVQILLSFDQKLDKQSPFIFTIHFWSIIYLTRNDHYESLLQLRITLERYNIMQASQPNKPYFIEFFGPDSTLRNKFKFVISASKVGELKEQVKLKLLGKKELQADSQIVMKDNDDFQLASDDEVQDVVTDSKVKIYLKAKNIPQPAVVAPSVPAPLPVVIVKDLEKLCQSTALDLTNFKIPVIAADIKHRLLVRCPQIPNSAVIQIPVTLEIRSFLELSQHIVNQLGISPSLKALLYNIKGQPFFYNLDLMNFPLPKLDFSEQMWVVFTNSPSTLDTPVGKPIQLSNTLTKISIQRGTDRYNLEIDLQNKVQVLRYKIYQITKFHPLNQVIKFAGKVVSNFNDSLKSQGIVNDSIIQVSFKLNGNLVPCTFADKFYYKDIKHIREQTEESIAQLRTTLLTLTAHLSADDKIKFVNFVRSLTKNNPLTFGLKSLFSNNFVSQVHRIAIEEGLLVALGEYLLKCKPQPDTLNWKEAFTKFRDFIGFVMEGSLKIALTEEVKAESKCLQVQKNCNITMGPIKTPRAYALDDGGYTIIDKEAFQEAILKGFTYPNLKAPKKENIISLPGFEEYFYQYLTNQIDNPNTNALFWTGFKADHPVFAAPLIETVEKYRQSLENYPDLKVHQPLQVKNKSSTYLLLKNKQGKSKIFVSRNKDISKPFNLFDVLTGSEQAVNLDLMGANVRSQNVEQVIDLGNLKPVITRPPKEAIAVLFDVSGSMGGQFFNEPDLKRIGAVKSFFEAFAYRTIAYNLEHVVSLFFFDHTVQNQCGFTEAIYDFNRLIAKAAPKGSTLMYDAVVKASDALVKFKIEHPDCILRIVALTDGEDTGSQHSIEQTTNILVKNNITIDSFAVGANCQGLKIISIASGGKCYLTRNLEESLKLFEQETVLSVRARKVNEEYSKLTIQQRIIGAKSMPFDLPNTVHEFKMPEAQVGLSAKDMIKKINKEGQGGKANSNGSLKRIAKQIQNYSDNPHPFVAIFPCSNINLWKILLLGPKSTPYENGLFLLYVQFPGDYPFKAPQVRFITPIYHCNMNSQGRICHSVFDRNYSPALTFRHIIDCVYGLILTPEPEDPLDNVIASFYLSDYQTYLKNAQQFTLDKASLTSEKIVDELFGKIVDDIERKQKEKQIEQWVTLAKSFN